MDKPKNEPFLWEMEERLVKTVPYSARLPIYYVEHAVLGLRKGQVTVFTKAIVETLPVASIAVLMIGPGCSVSAEAIKTAALRGCIVCFSGGGGIPVFANTVAYRAPRNKLEQARLFLDPDRRLATAKKLMESRSDVIRKWTSLPPLHLADIEATSDLTSLMLLEARWAKSAYAFCTRRNGPMAGLHGDKRGTPLALLNHFLYSVAMGACLHMGYDPNLGVIHGENRGGGLVFDLADIWKPAITLELSFISNAAGHDVNKMKALFIARTRETRAAEGIESTLKGLYK